MRFAFCFLAFFAFQTVAAGSDWRELFAKGRAQYRSRDYESAARCLRQALEEALKADAKADQVADIEFVLAAACIELGAPEEASRHFRSVVEVKTKLLGRTDPRLANYLSLLGRSYLPLEQYDAAESALAEALELVGFDDMCADPRFGPCLVAFAGVFVRRGLLTTARRLTRLALDAYSNVHPTPSARVAPVLTNLAWIAFETRELGDSEALLVQALRHYKAGSLERHRYARRSIRLLGRVYAYQGKHQKAEELLTDALRSVSSDSTEGIGFRCAIAELKALKKDYAEAERLLRDCAADEALRGEHDLQGLVEHALGETLRVTGRGGEARLHLERALQLKTRRTAENGRGIARTLHSLALVESQAEDWERSCGYAGRALRVFLRAAGPDDPETKQTLELYRSVSSKAGPLSVGLVRAASGKIGGADIDRLVSTAQKKLRRRDFEGAIETLDRILDLHVGHANAYHYRALARAQLGDYEKAVSDCTQAITWKEDYARAYALRANCHARSGRLDQAIVDSTRALLVSPDDVGAHYLRGLARLEKGDYKLAVLNFDRSIAGNDRRSFLYRGLARVELDRLDAAEADLGRALELRASPYAYLGLAAIERKRGNTDRAISFCTSALQVDEKCRDAYWERGSARFDCGQLDGALRDLRQYTEREGPAAVQANVYIWACRARRGEREVGTRELKRFLERLPPEDDEFHAKIGQYLVGALSATDLIAAAEASKEPRISENKCGAMFFLGVAYEIDGDVRKARDCVRHALATGARSAREYYSAVAQLKRLRDN